MARVVMIPGAPRPIVEAQVEYLRDYLEAFHRKCPFKVGDLVTPKKGYGLRQPGEPHIVVDVFEAPGVFWGTDPELLGTPDLGVPQDFRIASLSSDNENMYSWVNSSYRYEFWFPPDDKKGTA